MNPLVSIITPSYNSSLYIGETIKSVQEQTYQNWELLITDDCSTDNTLELIKRLANNDKRIKIHQLPSNQGSGPARNNSIKNAKGKYIAFLDSDDYWVPHKLSTQVQFMEDNHLAFSHSSYGYWDENGNEIRTPFRVSSTPVTYKDLLKRTEISCLTAIYNQEMIGKVYMPDLRRKQDYALWLAILKKGYSSFPQQDVLAYYRQRKGSATSKKYHLIVKHYSFLRQSEKMSIPQSLWYTGWWIWNGLLKYYL